MRVLIVEDEFKLARNIAKALQETSSFAVDLSHDGEDGQHLALTEPYDLIILDLMLPKVDGLAILRRLRRSGNHTPVLILSACDTSQDIINGLDVGSDDYLTKPFHVGELLARCRALIRRNYDQPDPIVCVGPLSLNTSTQRVILGERSVALRPMEYRLLEHLMLRADQVVTKADIIDHLYGFSAETFSNTVEVFISTLRKKLDPGPDHTLIHTIRGQGYLLGTLSG